MCLDVVLERLQSFMLKIKIKKCLDYFAVSISNDRARADGQQAQ